VADIGDGEVQEARQRGAALPRHRAVLALATSYRYWLLLASLLAA